MSTSFQESIKLIKNEKDKLVVIFYYEPYNRPALHFKQLLEKHSTLWNFAKVSIHNLHDVPVEWTRKFSLNTTPAIQVFWKGSPVRMRQSGMDDDWKFVGYHDISVWENHLRFARDLGEQEKDVRIDLSL